MAQQPEIHQLIDHLFRRESGRIVSVLTRIFGSDNLDLAEDVVQDSLLEAMRVWMQNGVPDNPTAWLFTVARNRALNAINREKYKQEHAADLAHEMKAGWTAELAVDQLLSEEEIQDDQLRMIFTCCHPAISPDSQITLALKTMCGFSIPEIARAFLTTEENINKRLVRARKKIRDLPIPFEVPVGSDLNQRLHAVLETIYLLFNEGYLASSGKDPIRFELCEEAMRLTEMIAQHPTIKIKTDVFALLALMQLNASRFNARRDSEGNIVTLEMQNRTLWDDTLKAKGFANLEKALSENQPSIYRILAAISAFHCAAVHYESTDWKSILLLYDDLLHIDTSPVVLLNRAIALSKVRGAATAIAELELLTHEPSLRSYHLFYSTKAELHIELGQFTKAIVELERAIALAPLLPERLLLENKLKHCREHLV